MWFNNQNMYVLTNIVGKYDNPLHDEIVGRCCLLDKFQVGEFGWFKVELEDGYHRICTSVVKSVSASDMPGDITVTTANSVYTFSLLGENAAITLGVEAHAER